MKKRYFIILLLSLFTLPLLFPLKISAQNVSPITFLEVSSEVNLDYQGSVYTALWTDVNNDNYPDLYISQHFLNPLLFINQRNGVFSEESAKYGLYSGVDRHGAAFGDLNNDGWVDFYQTSGAVKGNGTGPKELFIQKNGGGYFSNIIESAGIQELLNRGRSVNLVDFDNDGDLDIFQTNTEREGTTNSLYRNDGNNQYTIISASAGFTDSRGSHSSVWGDIDNDGDLDLIVSGEPEPDWNEPTIIYRNNQGHFDDVTNQIGSFSQTSFSTLMADFDNDGDLDLFFPTKNGSQDYYYRNDSGIFSSLNTFDLGINVTGNSVKYFTSSADFDNDGDLDLFVSRGGTTSSLLYQNLLTETGNLSFQEVSSQVNLVTNEPSQSHSHAWADFDNDGFLDLVFIGGLWDSGGIHLYKNMANNNHFIKLKLVGTNSNRDGIGAKITLTSNNRNQYRYKNPGGNYYSQEDPFIHFGLGQSQTVDRLIIDWPSGTQQEFTNLPANSFIEITEGQSTWKLVNLPDPTGNLLQNSNFENPNDITPWRLVTRGEGVNASSSLISAVNDNSFLNNLYLSLNSSSSGTETQSISLAQGPFSVTTDKYYRISFWGKASNANTPIQLVLRRSHTPWGLLAQETKNLQSWWAKYTVDFTPQENDTVNLVFDLGTIQFPVFLDNVYFEEKGNLVYSPLYPHPQVYFSYYAQDLQNPTDLKGFANTVEFTHDYKINSLDLAGLIISNNYSPFPPQ